MRINLTVPFADKDEAKALGARWDRKHRTWYVKDPTDIAPFLVWIEPREFVRMAGRKSAGPRVDSKPGVATPRTDFSLPDCGCTHVPAWEHCIHTEPQLTGDELSHIRAIAAA